jgi:type IV pilus assembly protein PilE
MRLARNRMPRPRGFTLIECLVTVVILAIFAALAAPGLTSQIRKARRSDAISTLLLLEQAQARWRAAHPSYAGHVGELPPVTTMNAAATRTASGRYDIRVAQAGVHGYVLLASALDDQQGDVPCQYLAVQVADRSTHYLAGATPRLEHGPEERRQCWKQ